MKNELLAELEQNSEELFRLLPSFTHEQFNRVPFEGSWTAAQVAAHLSKSETGVGEMLFGGSAPTGSRAADQHVPDLRSTFLNFELKMQSPDFVLPEMRDYEQDELITAFQQSRRQLKQALAELDLSQTATDFEFPTLGYLTRLELLTFAVVHAIRHTRQIKNIAAKVAA